MSDLLARLKPYITINQFGVVHANHAHMLTIDSHIIEHLKVLDDGSFEFTVRDKSDFMTLTETTLDKVLIWKVELVDA